MEYLYERVAYLRGLAEGLEIEETSKEGKIIVNIIDVLNDFADSINELNEYQEEIDEYVEAIDEDLSNVEDELFEDDDEDYDDFEDYEDYDYVEVECPHCKEYVYLDQELLENNDKVLCPNCHETIEVEMDECFHGGCCCEED